MKSRQYFSILFPILIVSLVLTAVIYKTLSIIYHPEDKLTQITASAAIPSFIALVWYTFETYKMRAAATEQLYLAQKQMEATNKQLKLSRSQFQISVMPRLAITFEDGNFLRILNVGNGVAIHISFQQVVVSEEFDIKLSIEQLLYLKPNEHSQVKVNSGKSELFATHLDTRYANQQFKILVTYFDLMNNKYEQQIELGKDGPVIGYFKRIERNEDFLPV